MSSSLLKVPAFGIGIGVVYFAAAAAAGKPGLGLSMFAVMLVFSVGLLIASRYSETVRHLLDRRDERISRIDLRANAMTGVILVLAIIGGGIFELANGRSGEPFTWLAAIAAVTYVVSVVFLRVRT